MFDDEEIADFIPPFDPVIYLDTDNPVTMGPVGVPDIYTEAKKQQEMAIRESRPVIDEVFEEFAQRFGRRYKPVETYKADDAEIVLLAQGSVIEAAEVAVDALRDQGKKVGAVELRLWRPFPFKELKEVLCGTSIKQVVVLDRCISYGGPIGPVLSEVRSALYLEKEKPMVVGVVAGLGGRDIHIEEYIEMFRIGEECLRTGKDSGEEPDLVKIVGLRE